MSDLEFMSKSELQATARVLDLPVAGNKPDLVARIRDERDRRAAAARAPEIDITPDDDDLPPAPRPPVSAPTIADAPDTPGVKTVAGELVMLVGLGPRDVDQGMVSAAGRDRAFAALAGAVPGVRGIRLAHVTVNGAGIPCAVLVSGYRPRGVT